MKKINFQYKDNDRRTFVKDEIWIETEPDDGYYLVVQADRVHIPQETLWDCTDEQVEDLYMWMKNGCVICMDGIWTAGGKDENVRTIPVLMMD